MAIEPQQQDDLRSRIQAMQVRLQAAKSKMEVDSNTSPITVQPETSPAEVEAATVESRSSALEIVGRADDQLAALDALIQEQQQIAYTARVERDHLAMTYEAEVSQCEEWRATLLEVEQDLGTAKAMLNLVIGTDGEDAAQDRVNGLTRQYQELVAQILAYTRHEAEHTAQYSNQMEQLNRTVEDARASAQALKEQREALVRARAEAHTQAGEDAKDSLVQDIQRRRVTIARLKEQLAGEEAALDDVRRNIRQTLAEWPDQADRAERTHGGNIRDLSPAAELARRWIAYAEYLDRHGKEIEPYALDAHVNIAMAMTIEQHELGLCLKNYSGASQGTRLYNKIQQVQMMLRGSDEGAW